VGPKWFLGSFEGVLQSDGYAAYDHVGGPKMVHAAYLAHYPESAFIQSKLSSRAPSQLLRAPPLQINRATSEGWFRV
jgi:hypothetical protein